MTSARVDEISPAYIGEDKLVLTLADPSAQLLAFSPFQINVDYSAAEPDGVVLPLELVFRGPQAEQLERRFFARAAPASLVLIPSSGGRHFVLLRELFHNRWVGRLKVTVAGEDLSGVERTRA